MCGQDTRPLRTFRGVWPRETKRCYACFECTLMAGKLQLPSAAIRHQFLPSSSAVRLSSLMSGAERTARALNKVSTGGLDLMGGRWYRIRPRPSNIFMTLFSN